MPVERDLLDREEGAKSESRMRVEEVVVGRWRQLRQKIRV
jgi:hypothetical protein